MQQFTNTERNLLEPAKIVSNGGVVIYPTDTVYGLGCDPYNESAVEKIFQIKIRENKPLPLLCNSLDYAQEVAYFDQISIKLADKFWPGPLTIILPIKDNVLKSIDPNINAGEDIKFILLFFFVLIIFTHRQNIVSLKNKTEQKIKI